MTIQTIKNGIIEFFTSGKFKTFLWQTANAFIVLVIAFAQDINWAYIPMVLGILNYLTKYINQKYLS